MEPDSSISDSMDNQTLRDFLEFNSPGNGGLKKLVGYLKLEPEFEPWYPPEPNGKGSYFCCPIGKGKWRTGEKEWDYKKESERRQRLTVELKKEWCYQVHFEFKQFFKIRRAKKNDFKVVMHYEPDPYLPKEKFDCIGEEAGCYYKMRNAFVDEFEKKKTMSNEVEFTGVPRERHDKNLPFTPWEQFAKVNNISLEMPVSGFKTLIRGVMTRCSADIDAALENAKKSVEPG